MKAFWINVDECIGRKEFMIEQFNNIKFITDNQRISAITTDDINLHVHDKDLPYKCDPSDKFFKNCKNCKVEHCTLLSHMNAIEQGYNQNLEWFIVFEDDTVIPHQINWDSFFKIIPEDAEVLQLHCCMGPTVEKLFELYKKDILWIPWKMIIPSASGYVVSKKAAKKMIDTYKIDGKFCFSNSKSCKLADVMTYETCKTYVHTYPLFYSDVKLGSLIHPDHLYSNNIANNIIKKIINENHSTHKFAIKIT